MYSMRGKNKQKEIANIYDEVKRLTISPLYQYRQEHKYRPVIGKGPLDAEIMFIGEAPGQREAKTGEPFVGNAGRVLNELLGSVNLSRDDVYITSLIHDRPPGNRDPNSIEIQLYSPFLIKLINIIQPRKLCTLGRIPMQFIMSYYGLGDKIRPISSIHGQAFKTVSPYGPIEIIPFFHPAYALYQNAQKQLLFKDFQVLAR